MAHRTRWPRSPATNCPVSYLSRCCTQASGVTFRGRSSKRSATPMGNSSGKDRTKRPGLEAPVGSSSRFGQP